MVALPHALVDQLGDLAVEMREALDAEGYTVGEALDKNPAFRRNNRPKSALVGSIMATAFERGAHRLGLNAQPGKGGSLELIEHLGLDMGIIRLRRAERIAGELHVKANKATTLKGLSDDGIFIERPYVFGWIFADDQPLELFAAEITGVEEGNPGHYLFGWVHEFSLPTIPPATGFQPKSDDDLGDWDAGAAGAAGSEAQG